MVYRGIVDNGVIRPLDPIDLPDGTEVAFHEAAGGSATPLHCSDAADWPSLDERSGPGRSIEELAQEQGVNPITSLDEIAGEWPEGDDIDEFLRSVREWRR